MEKKCHFSSFPRFPIPDQPGRMSIRRNRRFTGRTTDYTDQDDSTESKSRIMNRLCRIRLWSRPRGFAGVPRAEGTEKESTSSFLSISYLFNLCNLWTVPIPDAPVRFRRLLAFGQVLQGGLVQERDLGAAHGDVAGVFKLLQRPAERLCHGSDVRGELPLRLGQAEVLGLG